MPLIHLSFAHTYTHAQTDLQPAVHQLRKSYAKEGTRRLPLFDVLQGYMCEACHTSPHELQSEYIYGTKETFNKYHAKSCPSWKEGSPKTAVPTGCYFQALSSNQSIKPSKVFACPGPATEHLLNANVTEEDRRFSRLLTRTANGDLRPRQAAEGRGSVASLAADGSDGYHYHDVALTKLYIPDFLRRYVHNMDDFKSMFAKAGESPLSKGSILGDREQLLTDAMSSFLAFVNEDLREDSGLKKKQIRDAVGEKDESSPFRRLCEGVTNYASSSAQLVLAVVRRAHFESRRKEDGAQASGSPRDFEAREAAIFSKLPSYPHVVMAAAERLLAAVTAPEAGGDGRQAREHVDLVLRPLVHALLEALFHRDLCVGEEEEGEESCDPVRAHLIAQVWNEKGGFAPVSSMTHRVIHLKFLARATTYYSITSRNLSAEAKDGVLKYVRSELPGLSSTPFHQTADIIQHMRKLGDQEANKTKVFAMGGGKYAVNGKEIDMGLASGGFRKVHVKMASRFREISESVTPDLQRQFRCARRLGLDNAQPYEVHEDVSSSGHRDVGFYFGCQSQILPLASEVGACVLGSLQHDVGGTRQLSHAKAIEWLDSCDELTDMVVFMTYTASGAPCRGTELYSYQYRDTEVAQRNTRVIDNVIMHTEGNVKQTNMTGKAGEGARFLDPKTADFWIDYLALFRAIYDYLCKLVYGSADRNALYVQRGRPYTHKDVLSSIKDGFQTHALLNNVGVQEWRQVIEAYVRDEMGPYVQDEHHLGVLSNEFRRKLAELKGESYETVSEAHNLQV